MDTQESTTEAGRGPLVSRRAVAIGAAWTVPVIITAVAAPSASASVVPALTPTATMVHGTGHTYTLTLAFPAGTSAVVTILSILPTTTNSSTFTWTPAEQTAAPKAVFTVTRSGDNSSITVLVTYSLDGGATQQQVPVQLTSN